LALASFATPDERHEKTAVTRWWQESGIGRFLNDFGGFLTVPAG
jgi:alpha-glucuronidase